MKKIGIVGTGSMGVAHAKAWLNTEASLVACTAKHEDHAEQFATQYDLKPYPDVSSMLAEIDILDICAPTHLHYDMVLKAAKAGKQIFCEKPLARTLEQGQKMIKACQNAGVKLSVGHVVRFFPEYTRAKSLVDSGQIGQLALINLSRETFRPKKKQSNWFIDFEKSGGVILDLMIHDFDYAHWLAGEVESVYAKNISNANPDAQIDHALVILTHKNGVISHVEGSWAYPPPMFRTSFEISGSGGMIDHNSQASTPIDIYMHKTANGETADIPAPTSPVEEDPWTSEIKAFYAALRQDAPLPVPAEEGLAALQIALAAIESARTNKAVPLKSLTELSQ